MNCPWRIHSPSPLMKVKKNTIGQNGSHSIENWKTRVMSQIILFSSRTSFRQLLNIICSEELLYYSINLHVFFSLFNFCFMFMLSTWRLPEHFIKMLRLKKTLGRDSQHWLLSKGDLPLTQIIRYQSEVTTPSKISRESGLDWPLKQGLTSCSMNQWTHFFGPVLIQHLR